MSPVYAPPRFTEIPAEWVGPYLPSLADGASTTGGTNRIVGCRVIAQKSGFLRDIAGAIIAAAAGTMVVNVYDTGDTTTTVRTKIGGSGSIACSANFVSGVLPTLWDPGAGTIPVVAGRHYELALGLSDNGPTYLRRTTQTAALRLPDTHWVVPGACQPKIGWVCVTGIDPSTISEANTVVVSGVPLLCARISPT